MFMPAPAERRPDLPPWLQPLTQRLTPFVKAMVLVETLAYLVYVLVPGARDFIVSQLAVGPAVALGRLWQPLTALFVHIDPLQFLFNLVGLWFVGAAMEQALGRPRFVLVFFVPALAGYLAQGLSAALLGHPYVSAGCGLSVLSVFVAFGVHFNRTEARVLGGLVLQARTLAAILVGFSLLIALLSFAWPVVVGTVASVLLSYVMCGGRAPSLPPPLPNKRPSRPRVQMQVLEGGKGNADPRYLN